MNEAFDIYRELLVLSFPFLVRELITDVKGVRIDIMKQVVFQVLIYGI